MPSYRPPTPIEFVLADAAGFELRQAAWDYLLANLNRTGAERGNQSQQFFGLVAEMVVRRELGMRSAPDPEQPAGYDLLLPSGIRMDVKCRGGERPFQEEYDSSDGLKREAKHNLFARQLYDPSLETDIYLFTHLRTPTKVKPPGTRLQRNWRLHLCGWASKKRVIREGVYLPRGSLTERAESWFCYRGQEVEFYHRNLVGLETVPDLNRVDRSTVAEDESRLGGLNVTTADAVRILHDLIGRGILEPSTLETFRKERGAATDVKPILHPNQYHHLVDWLVGRAMAGPQAQSRLGQVMERVEYEGI